jgi:hypothetical protein
MRITARVHALIDSERRAQGDPLEQSRAEGAILIKTPIVGASRRKIKP